MIHIGGAIGRGMLCSFAVSESISVSAKKREKKALSVFSVSRENPAQWVEKSFLELHFYYLVSGVFMTFYLFLHHCDMNLLKVSPRYFVKMQGHKN